MDRGLEAQPGGLICPRSQSNAAAVPTFRPAFLTPEAGLFPGQLGGRWEQGGWTGSWVLRTSRPESFGVQMAKFRESTAGVEPRYLLCLVSSSKQS